MLLTNGMKKAAAGSAQRGWKEEGWMNKGRKRKKTWRQYAPVLFLTLAGAACGFLVGNLMGESLGEGKTLQELFWASAGLYLSVCASIFIQTVIHEAGHLVFGLMSGYRFCSFRIFSFMWLKEDGRIRRKRLSIAGTGGQCLMAPPDMIDGKLPVVLYNLGGSVMNVLAALVFGIFYLALAEVSFVSAALLCCAAVGLISAAANGIPMRLGAVDNDGYNAVALGRSAAAMRAFWVQMKVNEQLTKGVRLKDMPDEWFALPSDEEMQNSMSAALGVFACNRLMDAQCFEEADRLMAHMLEMESGMVGLHRSLLICDRMYIEVITRNRRAALDALLTAKQRRWMQQMKRLPSVLRTEYACALLMEKDVDRAGRIRQQFEKCAKTYPYQSDVQSERELLEIAKQKSAECSACIKEASV